MRGNWSTWVLKGVYANSPQKGPYSFIMVAHAQFVCNISMSVKKTKTICKSCTVESSIAPSQEYTPWSGNTLCQRAWAGGQWTWCECTSKLCVRPCQTQMCAQSTTFLSLSAEQSHCSKQHLRSCVWWFSLYFWITQHPFGLQLSSSYGQRNMISH